MWQVLEWLTLASAELSGSISDEKLSKLNAALASRTFLAGGAGPSLADLVLFGLLHPAVVRIMLLSCYFKSRSCEFPAAAVVLKTGCFNAKMQGIAGAKVGMPSAVLTLRLYAPHHRLFTLRLLLSAAVQSTLPAAQTNQSCNLLRWFDLIQHSADAAAAGFAAVPVPLPVFVPLPPPPPASSKPAASAATSATSAATGQVRICIQSTTVERWLLRGVGCADATKGTM
jgi:hypothetical protein